MRLVIAEKPSVAQALASALGVSHHKDGFMEGNDFLISWCCGHLAELADTSVYDEKYSKWDSNHLPIIPDQFRFTIKEDKRQQFNVLQTLLCRDDVTEVINACDAGREGEYIFRTVYHLAGCTKPMLRLWISSMEDEAILNGFRNLHPGKDFDGLYQAALCRSKADWLVGINATRFFSLLYGPTLNIGRVMSPTLALIVQREAEINAFKPEPFYTVQIDCGCICSSEKMREKQMANDVAAACKGQPITVTNVSRKEVAEKAPSLYDLTALQRDANRTLGYTAQQTLDYLQALYEKKLCTYPRTDSRYLTEDMAASVPQLVSAAAEICGLSCDHPQIGQICCNAKVTDHHAIVPTTRAASADRGALPLGEREILHLISQRLLCAVGPLSRTQDVTVTLTCNGHTFSAKGKTVVDAGWKAFLSGYTPTSNDLPPFADGQVFESTDATVKGGKTTSPRRFTEDTLLAAMENAGAKDMPEDAERKGIGTPATRAGILEKLISSGLVQRKKVKKVTQLQPTSLGMALITVLPEHLQSPLLTAEWEHRLKEVEHGDLDAANFLQQISDMLYEMIQTYQPSSDAQVLFFSGRDMIGVCPRCGAPVVDKSNGFFCDRKTCSFVLWKNSRFFSAKRITLTRDLASKLLEHGKAWLENCYSEKTGRTYSALVRLVDDGVQTSFKMDFGKGRP